MKSILENAQEEAPAHVWEGVSAGLDKAAKQKAVVIWWRRAAIGAAAAAVIAFGIFLGIGGSQSAQNAGNLNFVSPGNNMIAVVEDEQLTDSTLKNLPVTPDKVLIAKADIPQNTCSKYHIPSSVVQAQETVVSDYTEPAAEEVRHTVPARNMEPVSEKHEEPGNDSYWTEEEDNVKEKPKVSLIMSGLTGTNSEQANRRASIMKRPSLASGPAATGITETSTNSTYGIPVSAGLGVKIDLSKRWALGIGVNYSYLSRKFYGTYTIAENGVEISSTSSDIRNTQHFIGIPVNVYCNIVGNKHVNMYAYAGGTVEKCISDRYDVLSTSIVHKENPEGVQLSANVGLGVEFLLGRHLGLYVDPSLRYYFDNGQPKSIRTTQPLTLGFEMGLRVRL